jgi:hypothetical protein
MAQFGRSLGSGTIVAFALALAGCGQKAETTAATTTVGSAGPAEDGGGDEDVPSGGGTAVGAITAVDAARGDGGSLPPDSFGPSAYDLARSRTSHVSRHEDVSGRTVSNGSAIGELDGAVDAGLAPQSGGVIAAPEAAPDPAPRP